MEVPPARGEIGSTDGQLPIPGYDHLDEKKIVGQLPQLSQVDLAAVEAHETSHKNRRAVLHKVRWLTASEPMEGYDAMSPEEIVKNLAGADTRTLKGVREYENRAHRRRQVLDEVASALPASTASAEEDQAREAKAERVRSSMR
jgi:hypothetical protein